MKYVLLIVVTLWSLRSAYADVEPAIYFKGTIATKGRSVSGYFRVPGLFIGEWEGQFSYMEGGVQMHVRTSSDSVDGVFKVYPTEYHLYNAIKRSLQFGDYSLEVFPNAALLNLRNSNLYVPIMLGSPVKINSGEVDQVTVDIIHRFAAGEWPMTTTKVDDKIWLSGKPQLIVELGRFDMCEYTAYAFESGVSVKKELSTLKQYLIKMNATREEQMYHQLQLQINREVERLKGLKILIWSWCSC